MKTFCHLIMLLILGLGSACATVGQPAHEDFKPMLTRWQWAWNTTDPDQLVALFHPDSLLAIERDVVPKEMRKEVASLFAAYGKITRIRLIRSYDEATVFAVRIDFEKLPDFPVVFKCRQLQEKTRFFEFLPGQDPGRGSDSKVIDGFLKQWETAWNLKKPEGIIQLYHSFSNIQIDLKNGNRPKSAIEKEILAAIAEFGAINSYALREFKGKTNEYIVAFTYENGTTALATINLQKDQDGAWRIFRFHLNGGERALRTPDSWTAQ